MLGKILSAFVAVALAEGASSLQCEAPEQGCTPEQPINTNSLLQYRKGKKAELSSTQAKIRTGKDAPILYSQTSPLATNPQRGMVIMEHRMVGCFPRAEDDPANSPPKYMDDFCVNSKDRTSLTPCRSGLPFFRLQLKGEQSYLDCFSFCLSKGMDLFGVIAMDEGLECRCGASKANVEAWEGGSPRPELLLPKYGVDEDDQNCALVAWQYTGGLENGGVPPHLMEVTEAEQFYVDSITSGVAVSQDRAQDAEPEGGDLGTPAEELLHRGGVPVVNWTNKARLTQTGAAGVLAHKGLCVDGPTGYTYAGGKPVTCQVAEKFKWCAYVSSMCPVTCKVCSQVGQYMPCYPASCGGMPTWQTKNAEGKVIINYYFDDNTMKKLPKPEDTKAVFRLAAEAYAVHTCIELKEGTQASAPMPRIKVGHYDKNSCFAQQQGGNGFSARINLGWCKDAVHKGNMMHEIMHVLGVNHEQKRSDAADTITLPNGETRGPHLVMHWENIGKSWVPQYQPAASSYLGSGTDGGSDPNVGYAPYDYESIMHYRRGRPSAFDTIQSQFNTVVGQRAGFSDGDILQLNDMYQCTVTASSPTPGTPAPGPATPPATPAPTNAPTPAPSPAASPMPTVPGAKPLPLLPIWTASPWNVCEQNSAGSSTWTGQCNAGCVRKRSVTCTNATDGAQLDDNQCPGSMVLARAETCVCAETPCKDECQPGFLSNSGAVLTCSDDAVKHWCDNDNVDDPDMSAIVRERCPETCGTCPTPAPTAADGRCDHWCPDNNQPWSKKCTFKGCKICSDCSA